MDNNVLATTDSGGGAGNFDRARAGDLGESIAPARWLLRWLASQPRFWGGRSCSRNQSHQLADSGDVALRNRASGAVDRAVERNPAVSATKATVNLADNSNIKVEPAAAPPSEAEGLASSTRLAQGRAATELPNQVTK